MYVYTCVVILYRVRHYSLLTFGILSEQINLEGINMFNLYQYSVTLWLAPCRGRGELCVSMILQAKSAGTFMLLLEPLKSDMV